MSEATIAGLVGLILGSLLTFIASTIQFNRTKEEKRKDELRESYKKMWLLFDKFSSAVLDTTNGVEKAMEAGEEIRPFENERIFSDSDLAEAELYLLVYMPDGKDSQLKMHRATLSWAEGLIELARLEVTDTNRLSLSKVVDDKSMELVTIFETIKAEVISQLHKL